MSRNLMQTVMGILCWLWLAGYSVAAVNTELPVIQPGEVESVELFQFSTKQRQVRAITLAKNLRCPQCQNQNLIESNSPIAKDLRLEVYKMVEKGLSDEEVITFMTSRFGDFVLYKPKFEPKTYVLWLGPAALLLLFGFGGYRMVRRQQSFAEKEATK